MRPKPRHDNVMRQRQVTTVVCLYVHGVQRIYNTYYEMLLVDRYVAGKILCDIFQMEPERHAASLGLPPETLQQLLKARMAGLRLHSNSSGRISRSHRDAATADAADGDAAYDETFEEAPGGDEDDDPEMIPLGYVRPEDH